MATNIIVRDTKYFNALRNGPAFNLNTGDFSTHLLGNVQVPQRMTANIRIQTRFWPLTYIVSGSVDPTGGQIELTSGQNWNNEDIYVGGRVNLTFFTAGSYSFDVDAISADGAILTFSNVIDEDTALAGTLPNGSYGDGTKRDLIRDLSPSEGLLMKFGFVPNNGNVSYISPIDQVEQGYKFDGVRTASPTPVTGFWNNSIKGSDTGGASCEFVGDVLDDGWNGHNSLNSIQEFDIIQDFTLPFYVQGEFNELQSSIIPNRLSEELQHVIQYEFRQSLSNPNTSKFGEYGNVLGNINYFGQNYIDQPNQYSVSDVVLTDTATGQTISEINASSTTRVTCSVNSDSGTFLTTDPVLLNHSYLPNSDQSANQTDVYNDVWLFESVRQEIDGAAAAGTIITGFTATLDSANQIDLQFDIAFSVAQQTRIQTGYNYELSISVEQSGLTVPLSDVTPLIISAKQYSLNTDIAGLANFPQSYVYTRPMMYPIALPADRFTSLRGWIQDGFLYDWSINLDLVEEATLEALTLRLVAFNTLENTWFELDNYNYDLSGQVVTVGPPDVQNITVDTTRGYDLADGDKLNFAKLQTGTYSAPNQPYTGQTAFRLSWQDWIALPNADTVFYNPAELNNGLNKQSNRYSLQNNYVICVLIDARIGKVVDGTNVITQYINRSANLEVYDFGEQDGSPITWTGNIQTFDELGADLGGTILTEGLTTIKGTFAPDSLVTDPSLYWGEVRLEPLNNPGDNYFSLSTLEPGIDNNPLQAPTGSTYAKIEIVSGDVVVSADVNPDLLPTGSAWNPTVRMGLIDQSIPVVPTIKIQIDGNTRQVDGDFIVFQQTEIMAAAQFIPQLFTLSEAGTPGTPPGWQFKVSPTNAQPGGDAYDKTNWGAISYIDFTTLASTLGSESDRWVYVEADDTTKIDEGFIIEFERPGTVQATNNLVFTIGAEDIDLDRTIYFDRKITLNSITPSGLAPQTQLYVEVVTEGPNTVDWTTMEQLTGNNITTDLPTIQGLIDAIPDGDKYALRFHQQNSNDTTQTVTINFDYDSADLAEKTISLNQRDIDPEYRPFGQAAFFGPWPNADNIHCTTNTLDTAFLDLFDCVNNPVPWTIVFWGKPNNGVGDANQRDSIINTNNPASGNGAGVSFLLTRLNNEFQVTLKSSGGGDITFRWQPRFSTNRIGMFVLTHDGSATYNGLNCYYNALKMPDIEKQFFSDDPLTVGGKPANLTYYHGLFQSRTNGASNFGTSERLQIFDKELSAGEIRNLFNDPNAGRTARISNLFRDWDFANFAGGLVPELVASQDMTIVTGGSQPTSVSFY